MRFSIFLFDKNSNFSDFDFYDILENLGKNIDLTILRNWENRLNEVAQISQTLQKLQKGITDKRYIQFNQTCQLTTNDIVVTIYEYFIVNENGILKFQNIVCVPDVAELKKTILRRVIEAVGVFTMGLLNVPRFQEDVLVAGNEESVRKKLFIFFGF